MYPCFRSDNLEEKFYFLCLKLHERCARPFSDHICCRVFVRRFAIERFSEKWLVNFENKLQENTQGMNIVRCLFIVNFISRITR